MAKRMLIDASHPEETRVVVVDGSRVDDFDFESATRKQLRGNIYLARVTRVEPSLQAAFVEYGGNRHGFLAFSEIHPDYYQIPVADRQALLEAEARARRSEDDDEDDEPRPSARSATPSEPDEFAAAPNGYESSELLDNQSSEAVDITLPATGDAFPELDGSSGSSSPVEPAGELIEAVYEIETPLAPAVTEVENDAVTDALEEVPSRPVHNPRLRSYKIQEVIKKRQILLVQVVKEERGTKGAALTTYLSLAGRYCVLMPNTARGGGISRKITNAQDRKRLKEAASDLDVPEGMGLIVRTAGANRTKQEIRRDFEYLLRQWESVRELTLRSTAPALIYEEGSLIKRSLRDLYNKDIEEIVVQGRTGQDEATGFMGMLMPGHVEDIRSYDEPVPLFQRFGVEGQLDALFSPRVQLRSGGYIVINQTEALVSVDVNSGRATREHHIEDTALKTNLEASDEVARQLRLRDLAGLIVIDFIDMEDHRHNRAVEKRLKDALKHDRARIQVGRISPFGLLEMSRQRLRAGIIEGSTHQCPHCAGAGLVRSVESMAVRACRALDEEATKQKTTALTLRAPSAVAAYLLNLKRAQIAEIEQRHGLFVYIESADDMPASEYAISRGAPVAFEPRKPREQAVGVETAFASPGLAESDFEETNEPDEEAEKASPDAAAPRAAQDPDGERRGRRRRRRRGGRRDVERADAPLSAAPNDADAPVDTGEPDDMNSGTESDPAALGEAASNGDGERRGRRRRRGRRGGRGGRREDGPEQNIPAAAEAPAPLPPAGFEPGFDDLPDTTPGAYEAPRPAMPPAASLETGPSGPDSSSAERKEKEPSTLASFFGFGTKPAAEPAQPKRGWWQRNG